MGKKLQLIGWGMFVVCAILFIISGIKNQDIIITMASVIFLLACVVFIIDLKKN